MKTKSNLSLGFLLSVLLSVGGCSHSESADHGKAPKLEVTNPLRKDMTITREYVGQVRAIRHVEIKAMEKGFIEQIFVDEGQLVKKDQPMFKLMQNHHLAELNKSTAEASALQIEYENTKALAESSIVSQNELALAKAKLDKANADVSMAKTHLAWTEVDAPFDGLVDRLLVRQGSYLEEGGELTNLSDVSKMWVYFNVHEADYLDYMADHQKNSDVKVQLKMANGQIFNQLGTIETIVAEFDNKTGNIEFRATFPNPEHILRHGQTGSILISIPHDAALVIPQKATFEVLDKTYVYSVDDAGTLDQRLIAIGAELPHLFIVQDGLAEGDVILLEGLRKVQKGDKIVANFKEPTHVIDNLGLYAE